MEKKMHVRLTRWECRRLIDILTSGVVGKDNLPWARNLAGKIEVAIRKQSDGNEPKEQ